jgi:hypothetical protein
MTNCVPVSVKIASRFPCREEASRAISRVLTTPNRAIRRSARRRSRASQSAISLTQRASFDVALVRQNNARLGSPIPASYGVRELAPALEGDESGVKPPHSIDRHAGRQWTPLVDGRRSRDTVLTFRPSDVKATHSAILVYVTCNTYGRASEGCRDSVAA